MTSHSTPYYFFFAFYISFILFTFIAGFIPRSRKNKGTLASATMYRPEPEHTDTLDAVIKRNLKWKIANFIFAVICIAITSPLFISKDFGFFYYVFGIAVSISLAIFQIALLIRNTSWAQWGFKVAFLWSSAVSFVNYTTQFKILMELWNPHFIAIYIVIGYLFLFWVALKNWRIGKPEMRPLLYLWMSIWIVACMTTGLRFF